MSPDWLQSHAAAAPAAGGGRQLGLAQRPHCPLGHVSGYGSRRAQGACCCRQCCTAPKPRAGALAPPAGGQVRAPARRGAVPEAVGAAAGCGAAARRHVPAAAGGAGVSAGPSSFPCPPAAPKHNLLPAAGGRSDCQMAARRARARSARRRSPSCAPPASPSARTSAEPQITPSAPQPRIRLACDVVKWEVELGLGQQTGAGLEGCWAGCGLHAMASTPPASWPCRARINLQPAQPRAPACSGPDTPNPTQTGVAVQACSWRTRRSTAGSVLCRMPVAPAAQAAAARAAAATSWPQRAQQHRPLHGMLQAATSATRTALLLMRSASPWPRACHRGEVHKALAGPRQPLRLLCRHRWRHKAHKLEAVGRGRALQRRQPLIR